MKKLFSNSIIIRIIISIVLFVISFFIDNDIICTFLLIISYIILTYEMFINALENILSKQFFDENTLMIIATTGAFLINRPVR